MSATRVDVAVVGGGLAGCSAAITLARQGYRVALVEAKAYPQDKVCGEVLSPECHALLDNLGVLPAIRMLKPARLTSARITAPDGSAWMGQFQGEGIGVSRYALDAALADRARRVGAMVREYTTVTDIRGDLRQGFALSARSEGGAQTIRARMVIAAYGKRSPMDRVLGRDFLRQRAGFVGLKAHFRGPAIPHCVELHAFPGGYCGLSEIEGGLVNVCLLAREDVFRRAGDIDGFIAWMRGQNPYLRDWLSRATRVSERWLSIAQVSFADKPPVERDVLLTGDAAGLIAPLAGNGMAMALEAGAMAAVCSGAFLSGEMSAEALRYGYARAWRRQYGARLRLGRLLQAALIRPTMLQLGLRMLHFAPGLGQYFMAHTRDTRLVSLRSES